jgi:hypothetical protein
MKYNFGLDAMNNPRKSISGDICSVPESHRVHILL